MLSKKSSLVCLALGSLQELQPKKELGSALVQSMLRKG